MRGAAPAAVAAILSDIYHSIDQLIAFPRSGPRVPGHRFRRIVTPKYHFKIAYTAEHETITILGIYRFQDRES